MRSTFRMPTRRRRSKPVVESMHETPPRSGIFGLSDRAHGPADDPFADGTAQRREDAEEIARLENLPEMPWNPRRLLRKSLQQAEIRAGPRLLSERPDFAFGLAL